MYSFDFLFIYKYLNFFNFFDNINHFMLSDFAFSSQS
ncbi:hypothetical protein XFF6991_4929 [Xanthomonas phaseoli pv. phaseoli]|uniref:Uncharacterized protein n=1 Tax=Xanthomonas campestris pv. phaseoli TaxID=317013 RepID=A0A7Z7IV95_XANCH|nr:hypothetical protein XFF6991_4929 [Xanthomonas phaseoli pv. phaseoli]